MDQYVHGVSEPRVLADAIVRSQLEVLVPASLEPDVSAALARLLPEDAALYETMLLGTRTYPRRWYDWNVGFLIPHLNVGKVIDVLTQDRAALSRSEGIAWGLGEAGNDDRRIIDFLYFVTESCLDYDAWWCAADALEKLGECDSTDLKKRTLKGGEWADLNYCLSHLEQRAAIIGALKLARVENTSSVVVPACRVALRSVNRATVQNAVWLIERLRLKDDSTIEELLRLYEKAEDLSHTLRPRIVEALGQIGAPEVRPLLEEALQNARYYRTRAYAAQGLGKIGDQRSLPILKEALAREQDERVIGEIAQAIYSLEHPQRRKFFERMRRAFWPENGMIVDQSNDWYTNPEVYDRFSSAEDPLGTSLTLALSYLPPEARIIADLGTGTGRFALLAAEQLPNLEKVYALDANPSMHNFLSKKLRMLGGLGNRVEPLEGNLGVLPFEDQTLDAVISSWAFPSKMWQLEVCLKEVREVLRVLKPNGVLITVGWDETFRDQLSELWFRFVPEPDFRRETMEEWRRRRRDKIRSPRNCHLTFVKRNLRVPLLFSSPEDAAFVLGNLFGFAAGQWVSDQQRCEFSIRVGITRDTRRMLVEAEERLVAEIRSVPG